MRVIFGVLQRLERVSTVEVFRDVSTNVSLDKEFAAWVTRLELGDVQDQIVQDYKLLLFFLDLLLELFVGHDVYGLVEGDRLLAKEFLMPCLKSGKECDKE